MLPISRAMRVGPSIPGASIGSQCLTQQQKSIVAQLNRTDEHVRAHEQAHLAASGGYAKGGPSYTYTTGPDGQQYACGGEVQIDTSPIAGDPEATIQKAETIRAAAQAPADPSSQDRAVAAQASQVEIEAQQELSQVQQAAENGYGKSSGPDPGALISITA